MALPALAENLHIEEPHVFINNGKAVTTSQDVADYFNKLLDILPRPKGRGFTAHLISVFLRRLHAFFSRLMGLMVFAALVTGYITIESGPI